MKIALLNQKGGTGKTTLSVHIAAAFGFDDIVIDGPPRVNDVAKSAIAAADLVLIPVQPSPYDVWAAKEIVDLIDEVRTLKPEVAAVFVVNRKIVNTAIGRDVVGALAGYELPVLRSTIGQRVTFAESAASGSTVMELLPAGPAAVEVRALVAEIMELMECQKK
jgi:chromosome partitioning protein